MQAQSVLKSSSTRGYVLGMEAASTAGSILPQRRERQTALRPSGKSLAEPKRELEVLMAQSSNPTTKPHCFPFRCCLGLGLERKVLPPTEGWLVICHSQSVWPSPGRRRLPSSQLRVKACDHAQDSLICFDNDSWIIWPLNVCCQRDLYCGCDGGYLLETLAWYMCWACFVSTRHPCTPGDLFCLTLVLCYCDFQKS